jgi:DNA mismatch endonuclease, patch repair protein
MISKYGFNTSQQRSKLMSRIKGKNTSPELILRKALWSLGYRYRLNVPHLPGKPDLVFGNKKIVVFIDGEFWHGYNWQEKKKTIKANKDYWVKKIEGNMNRDIHNIHLLESMGYTVLRFWEKEIKKELDMCVGRIVGCLNS